LSDVCLLFIQETAANQEGLKLNASTIVVGVTLVYSQQIVTLEGRIAWSLVTSH